MRYTFLARFKNVEGSCCHFLFSCYSFSHAAYHPPIPVCFRTIRLPVCRFVNNPVEKYTRMTTNDHESPRMTTSEKAEKTNY